MIKLTYRTCSLCNYWGDSKIQLNGVVAAECGKLLVPNKSLGTVRKITKGGDSCSNWSKIKYKMIYNPYTDTNIRVKDLD